MTQGRLSKAGAAFSAAHEAIYLYAYPDPGTGGEPWTGGIGHTRAAGLPNVKRGDRYSMTQVFDMYANDMGAVERDVRSTIKVELNQHEFDAACSFHLNTGALRSGSVDDKLNRGDRTGAFTTWGAYINAGGKPMKGLRTRRAEEIALFRTGHYPSRKILVRDTPTGSGRYISADSIPWRDFAEPGSAPAGGAVAPSTPVIVLDVERPPVVIVKSPVTTPKTTAIAKPIKPVAPAPAVKPWYQRATEWLLTG